MTWSIFRLEWIIYVMKEADILLLVVFLMYVRPPHPHAISVLVRLPC
jgi:hypothetical protein